jgi:hypothetical protein
MTCPRRLTSALLFALVTLTSPASTLAGDTCTYGGSDPGQSCAELAKNVERSLDYLSQRRPRPKRQLYQCKDYRFEVAPFGMANLIPKYEKIQEMDFPRNHRMLYRGTELAGKQFDTSLAARAMLGDTTAFIGSRLYSSIRSLLMGDTQWKNFEFRAQLDQAGISASAETLIKCGKQSPAQASLYAADLVDKYFLALQSKNFIGPQLLDENSGSFVDFSPGSIYSSAYQVVAGWYGGKTLLHRERAPRSIDKHHWERKTRGTEFTTHPWKDAGEFVTPGYVLPEDVQGVWLRDKDTRMAVGDGNPPDGEGNGITWAIEKYEIAGITYIAILEGGGMRCIERDSNQRPYFCERNYPKPTTRGLKPLPILEKDKPVPVAALIKVCPATGACPAPAAAAWNHFAKKSAQSVPDAILKPLLNLTIAGAPVAGFKPGSDTPISK